MRTAATAAWAATRRLANVVSLSRIQTPVATLTPDATGHATQQLKQDEYVLRVTHSRYAAEARRIQVMPQRWKDLPEREVSGRTKEHERIRFQRRRFSHRFFARLP